MSLRVSSLAALLGCCLAASGCGKKVPPTSDAPTASGRPTSATAAPTQVERPPLDLRGSTVALLPDESALIVAGEDHDSLFVVPPELTEPRAVRVVSLPGPPAEVVALDGRLLVTVRTLPSDGAREARAKIRGPAPSPERVTRVAAARSSGSGAAAQPSAAPKPPAPLARKRNTPAAPFDPSVVRKSRGGLLLTLTADPSGAFVETGRVTLSPDAWGLALTPDRRRALVTSAWAGEVALVDLASQRVLGVARTAREPRGVVALPDGKTAYVSHLVGSSLTRLELSDAGLVATSVDLPAAPARTPPGATLGASLGYDLVLAPDAETLFVPRHALGAEGAGSWWGAPTVDALDLTSLKPVAPAHRPGSPRAVAKTAEEFDRSDWLPKPGQAPEPDPMLVQPRAVQYRRSTDTLLVASEGSDVLVELDALAADPAMARLKTHKLAPKYDPFGGFPDSGGGPAGVALSSDEQRAYVYCRTTFDVVRVDLESGAQTVLHLADDGLPADAAYGRRLYTNARNQAVSGGLGCAACHPEGRDDGYVWREGKASADDAPMGLRFVGRRENLKLNRGGEARERPLLHPRQTPMLAGRMRAMGPFGWLAENKDIVDRLIAGFQLHRAGWDSSYVDRETTGEHIAKIDYIADYLRSGLLPPPTLDRRLDATELRGKAIFESDAAMCARCHVPGSEFTDRQALPLPPLPTRAGFDAETTRAFKTPSLWFIGGSAPYFHDGSRATLEELVNANADRMGKTSHLTAEERAALVAYLRVL